MVVSSIHTRVAEIHRQDLLAEAARARLVREATRTMPAARRMERADRLHAAARRAVAVLAPGRAIATRRAAAT